MKVSLQMDPSQNIHAQAFRSAATHKHLDRVELAKVHHMASHSELIPILETGVCRYRRKPNDS